MIPWGRTEVEVCRLSARALARRSRAHDHDGMLAAFSLTPLGTGDSVSASVAAAVRLVRESGLPNETNAMFTNVEGEWDEVMDLIKSCVMEVSKTSPRVSLVIKVDHRPGAVGALQAKVAAVEAHLADGEEPQGRAPA